MENIREDFLEYALTNLEKTASKKGDKAALKRIIAKGSVAAIRKLIIAKRRRDREKRYRYN